MQRGLRCRAVAALIVSVRRIARGAFAVGLRTAGVARHVLGTADNRWVQHIVGASLAGVNLRGAAGPGTAQYRLAESIRLEYDSLCQLDDVAPVEEAEAEGLTDGVRACCHEEEAARVEPAAAHLVSDEGAQRPARVRGAADVHRRQNLHVMFVPPRVDRPPRIRGAAGLQGWWWCNGGCGDRRDGRCRGGWRRERLRWRWRGRGRWWW